MSGWKIGNADTDVVVVMKLQVLGLFLVFCCIEPMCKVVCSAFECAGL